MKKLIAISAGVVVLASSAWATNPPPPTPTPAPNNIQGQTQGQGQGQLQGQGQQQRAIAKGGAGGSGGAGGVGVGGAGGVGGSQSQGQTVNVNNSDTNNGNGSNNGVGNNGWNGSQFPVASATAPSFAIGQCQWAISGGAQFFGFGGSAGGAGLYEFCKAMMQADHFRKLGRDDVAKMLECNNENFRAAYMMAGTPCRQDVPKDQLAVTPIVQPVGWTAPVQTAAPVPVPISSGTAPAPQQQVLNRGGLQCVDAAGRPVPMGQPGAVRCN